MSPLPVITLKRISADDTYNIRHLVLRPKAPIEHCHFEGDFDADTFHLGAFLGDKIVGIASFRKESCTSPLCQKYIDGNNAYRLRGMANLPECRGRGIGRALLIEGEQQLRAKNCEVLWFNAREVAFPFYQKLGYKFNSEMFNIAEVGPHKIMYKHL